MSNSTRDNHLKESWEAFCEELKAAGDLIFRETTPDNDLARAKGLRLLARNISLGLQFKFDNNDRMFPEMNRYFDPMRKQGGDNSECVYMGTQLDGRETYRIFGDRSSAKYFSVVAVEEGDPWGNGTIATLYGKDIETDANGNFELFVSPHEHEGNWLKTTEKTFRVTFRQYFADWEKERPMRVRIERLSSPEITHPENLSLERLSKGLVDTARWVDQSIGYWPMMLKRWESRKNEFLSYWQLDDTGIDATPGGDPIVCYWQLPKDEYLIVKVRPVDCTWWGVEFGNIWWETVDYRYRLSNTNEHYAQLEDDGMLTVVVAHEDPGVPNWLDCSGFSAGYITFRWMLADEHPIPKAQQVKFAVRFDHMPDNVKRMGPDERIEQLAERKSGVYARFGY